MALINVMQELVRTKIEGFMKNNGNCKCEQCLDDIMCIALNKLPPKYVSTTKGELFSRIDQEMIKQNTVDIDIAVLGAIEFVRRNPKHEIPTKE